MRTHAEVEVDVYGGASTILLGRLSDHEREPSTNLSSVVHSILAYQKTTLQLQAQLSSHRFLGKHKRVYASPDKLKAVLDMLAKTDGCAVSARCIRLELSASHLSSYSNKQSPYPNANHTVTDVFDVLCAHASLKEAFFSVFEQRLPGEPDDCVKLAAFDEAHTQHNFEKSLYDFCARRVMRLYRDTDGVLTRGRI